MKAAALIYMASDGTLGAIASQTLDPLLAQAKAARVSGKIGKTTITGGVVLANWRTAAPYSFVAEKPKPAAIKAKE